LGILNCYLADAYIFKAGPTVSKLKKEAQKIEKSARTLAKLLADASELGQATVGKCWPWERYLSSPSFSNPSATIRLLRDLAFKARQCQEDLPIDKPGRSQKAYLAPFIAAVGRVYDDAGGKRRGVHKIHSKAELDETYGGVLFKGICWLLDRADSTYMPNTVAQVIEDWRRDSNQDKYKKPENWS
ncbi:MAG: hypothetical protein O6759_02020, partial [Candidatus Dadabacteria bacterium]|nr:hypothetical protein [Candidatus Dadabacteria bacterium]